MLNRLPLYIYKTIVAQFQVDLIPIVGDQVIQLFTSRHGADLRPPTHRLATVRCVGRFMRWCRASSTDYTDSCQVMRDKLLALLNSLG